MKKYLFWILSMLYGYSPIVAQNGRTIFEDDFETGMFKSDWVLQPNLEGTDGVIDITQSAAGAGIFGVRIGKTRETNSFTTNALDLKVDLTGEEQVFFSFKIRGIGDEGNEKDGIYLKEQGANEFVKVFNLDGTRWCSGYGQYPPLNLTKLAEAKELDITKVETIRIQQFGFADFITSNQEDGYYLDDVRLYDPQIKYANIPFEDDFEKPNLDPSWNWGHADSTIFPLTNTVSSSANFGLGTRSGVNESFGVFMGKRCDQPGTFVTNALDLHLDLEGEDQIALDFDIRKFGEETHLQDGIYFSSDGGCTFIQVLQFRAGSWCGNFGRFPTIDVDFLAAANNIAFTSTFVIRFQQHDDADFNTSNDEDGLYLDNVKVYDPEIVYTKLPFFDDFETGALNNSWAWAFADSTTFPLQNTSSPSSNIGLGAQSGKDNTFGLFMGKRCDQGSTFVTNALDLHLDLAGEEQVALEFDIRSFGEESHIQDGLFFSSDGVTFKQVLQFEAGDWCGGFGKYPPIDVDFLAASYNIPLTSTFVIRFQQHDNADFNTSNDEDGFFLDNIHVYDPNILYAELPFFDDFETGSLNNSWAWSTGDSTDFPLQFTVSPSLSFGLGFQSGIDQSFGAFLGKRCDQNVFNTASLDLHLNLFEGENLKLSFYLRDRWDETQIHDGIYYGVGKSFQKIYDFDFANQANNIWVKFELDLSAIFEEKGITPSHESIIRFQQHDNADFNTSNDEDGFYLDSILVEGNTSVVSSLENEIIPSLRLFPNPNSGLFIIQASALIQNIRVSNLFGQMVPSNTILAGQKAEVGISEKGLFLVEIMTERGKILEKVVVH